MVSQESFIVNYTSSCDSDKLKSHAVPSETLDNSWTIDFDMTSLKVAFRIFSTNKCQFHHNLKRHVRRLFGHMLLSGSDLLKRGTNITLTDSFSDTNDIELF